MSHPDGKRPHTSLPGTSQGPGEGDDITTTHLGQSKQALEHNLPETQVSGVEQVRRWQQ